MGQDLGIVITWSAPELRRMSKGSNRDRFVFSPSSATRDFSQNCTEYKLANWNRRHLYYPSVPNVTENPKLVEDIHRLVLEGNVDQVKNFLHANVPQTWHSRMASK